MPEPNSPPTSSDGQNRKRKSRNSDARKEQNRIASRAYREKRRQKLALLDEILKSDSHTDSMSSVSDETDYSSMTPAPDFRVPEPAGRTSRSSNSPASYYMSMVPELSSMAATIQPLPSNGPNRDTGAYVNYPAKDYGQEPERLATQSDYACNPNISMSSGYASPLPSVTSMPTTPMYPFDDVLMGVPFSAYPPLEVGVPGLSSASGCDSDMINALQSLSRLNDNQQQQIVAYIQKRRSQRQANTTDQPFQIGYGGYHIPVQRSSPVPGQLQPNEDAAHHNERLSGQYTP